MPTLPPSNFQIHTTHTNICVCTYTQIHILATVVRLRSNKLPKLRDVYAYISQLQTELFFFYLWDRLIWRPRKWVLIPDHFDSAQLDKESTGVGGRRKGSTGCCCFIYSRACICLWCYLNSAGSFSMNIFRRE